MFSDWFKDYLLNKNNVNKRVLVKSLRSKRKGFGKVNDCKQV